MAKKIAEIPKKRKTGWVIIIVVLAVLGLFSFMIAGLFSFLIIVGGGSETRVGTGNVAVITIKQPIYTERVVSGFSTVGVSSTDVVNMIREADSDSTIDAIVLEINSPGGSAVASEEIVTAVKNTRKPTVAWIREVGASGAYWVASASDHIVASKMSIVGSIGVIASYVEFSGLMERYNVSYERMVAGKYKDMGTPYRSLTDEERNMFQEELDEIHKIFRDDVAESRGIPEDKIIDLGQGQIFLGVKAIENGLIDQIGGKQEVINYLQQQLGMEVSLVEFRREVGLWDLFSMAAKDSSFQVGRGIGSSLKEDDKSTMIIT